MNNIPKKPETIAEQVSMMWDALYNHVPHRLRWQDIKINFILAFMALLLTGLGVVVAWVVLGL